MAQKLDANNDLNIEQIFYCRKCFPSIITCATMGSDFRPSTAISSYDPGCLRVRKSNITILFPFLSSISYRLILVTTNKVAFLCTDNHVDRPQHVDGSGIYYIDPLSLEMSELQSSLRHHKKS